MSNVTNCIRPILPRAVAVRAVSFNKTEDTNWALPWHQDRVISVAEKEDISGYTNWSRKAGLWHCEPPPEILENMLAVRIHLDDADHQTGALEILKASHKFGKVIANQTKTVLNHCEPIICTAKTGDVLIMKMLTLHRSKPSKINLSRRAIRIDYSAGKLPKPLQWETD